MKHTLFFLSVWLNCTLLHGQTVIKGIITDVENNKPVPYVSIGVIHKPNGTVSNSAGAFELVLGNKINDNDTLRFSSIGYQSIDLLIGDLKSKGSNSLVSIALKKVMNELKPVIIKSKNAKVKILGYETNSKLFGLGFGTSAIGSEGGVAIPIKHQNTNIENLSFFIIQNPFTHLTFRVNIYDIKSGKPGINILNENLLVNIENKQTGKITIDLTRYNVYVNDDILITLEWIEASPVTNRNLDVAAVLFGTTFMRQASQFIWVKSKKAGVGISVKANY